MIDIPRPLFQTSILWSTYVWNLFACKEGKLVFERFENSRWAFRKTVSSILKSTSLHHYKENWFAYLKDVRYIEGWLIFFVMWHRTTQHFGIGTITVNNICVLISIWSYSTLYRSVHSYSTFFFNLLTPRSDQHVTSPHNIHTLTWTQVIRILKPIILIEHKFS